MKMKRSCMPCVLLLLCGLWSSVCQAQTQIDGEVGGEVTLDVKYRGDPSEINWKVDNNKVVDMELRPKFHRQWYRLNDRAKISESNGRLTIRDLQVGDSGQYKAEVLVDNLIQETYVTLTVREIVSSSRAPTFTETSSVADVSFRSSANHTDIHNTKSSISTILIVLAVILILVSFVVCWWWWCVRGKKRKRNMKGESSNNALLEEVNIYETEAGDHVKAEEGKVSVDTPGPEAGNNVQMRFVPRTY